MIDISELMDDPDFASAIVVTRAGTATRDADGVLSFRPPAVAPLTAIVQPASAADKTDFLPEGERQGNAVKLWSRTPVLMADGEGQQADTFIYLNGNYRVAYSKTWDQHGFHFAIATGYVP